MNLLKSILAALFVGELAYFIAVIVIAIIDMRGIKKDLAIGVGALLTYLSHPAAIGVAALALVLALLLFLRT